MQQGTGAQGGMTSRVANRCLLRQPGGFEGSVPRSLEVYVDYFVPQAQRSVSFLMKRSALPSVRGR